MLKQLRAIVFLLLAALALNSCETRRPAATAETARPAMAAADTAVASAAPTATAPARPAVADTAAPYPGWPSLFDSVKTAPLVQLAGQAYTISTAARADSSQSLCYVRPFEDGLPANIADSAGGETQEKRTFRGVEARYTITLRDAAGRSVFTRRFSKQEFRKAVGPEWVTDAAASPPNYLGYWPQHQALVFRFDFAPGATDFFATALLLLDERTGRTRALFYKKTFGSTNSPDAPPTLAPNGRLLLLPHEVRYADGRRKSLERPEYDVAGSRLLNDSTILVAYEPEETLEGQRQSAKKSQTVLLNSRAQQVKAFVFSPVMGGLGYWLSYQYLAQTRTHYLYDGAARALLLVPRDGPQQARLVRLRTLPKFGLPRRPSEVTFGFHAETEERVTLWVDTVGGVIRYQ